MKLLGPPHGTIPAVVITCEIDWKQVEAVKMFKGRRYGPYCAIAGNKPSSVTLHKPATIAR